VEVRVVAIGHPMPGWIADGWRDYSRRMPSRLDVKLVEVAAPRRRSSRNGGKGAGDLRGRESEALLARCSEPGVRIALDEGGNAWSTRDLARLLDDWMMDGVPVNLLIGGAEGHHPSLLDSCRARWSLGPLTFPHMLVRVIVAEQLYRAWTLLSGHPYHRD